MSRNRSNTHLRMLSLTTVVVALLATMAGAQVQIPNFKMEYVKEYKPVPPGGSSWIGPGSNGNQGPKVPPGGASWIGPGGKDQLHPGTTPKVDFNHPPKGLVDNWPQVLPPKGGLKFTPQPVPPPPAPPKGPKGGGKGGSHHGGHGHHGRHGTDVGAIIGGGLNLLGGLVRQPPQYHIYQGGYPQGSYGQQWQTMPYTPPPVDAGYLGPVSQDQLIAAIERTERELERTRDEMQVRELQADFARRAAGLGGLPAPTYAQARQRLWHEYQSWLRRQLPHRAPALEDFASYWQQLQDPDLAWSEHERMTAIGRTAAQEARSLEEHLARLRWRLGRR